MAFRIFRRLRELIDVDTTGVADGDALTYDAGSETWIPGAGGGGGASDAASVTFTPAGNIAATDVQAALEELDSEKQPSDSDLTAIAALSTTAFGRSLLVLANQAALLSAAGAAASSHVHDGADITTGTVADARIAATIARDSEVTAAVAAEATARDSAISTAIANLVASAPGVLDTLDEIAAALGDDPNFAATMTTALAGKQPLDSDLTAIAALTTTAFGRSVLETANAAALRTLAGLVIGTDVEAHDADLTTIAGLTPTNDDVLQRKAGAWANRTIAQLLSDLAAAGTTFQPLDSDLTSIAALATTSFGRSVLTQADAAALRTLAGLVIGTDVEAHDSDLTTIAGLSPSNDDFLQRKSGAWTNRTVAQVLADLTAAGISASALTKAIAQTAHGLAVGDVVRLSGTNYVKAQADSAANAEVAGIVSAVADANNFTLHVLGRITGLTGLTAGTAYFLSPSSSGALTATEPTTAGQVSKPVLIADTTTSGLFFNFRGSMVAVAPSSFIQTLLDDADAATARATLGVIASLFQSGGAQALALDTLGAPTDITTLNASTSAHGLLKKLPNDATQELDGVGNWKQTGWNIVTKAADESVTSSTTLQNDDDFSFTAVNGALYEIEFVLLYTGAAAGDFKVAMGEDATATRGVWGAVFGFTNADAAAGVSSQVTNQSANSQFGAGATARPLKLSAVHVGAGGTFRLLWAQATSDPTATVEKAGSIMRYRRVI